MSLTNNKPIGIFDSGIGGLTVANAVYNAFPKEQFIYFGDTFHLPYGEKSIDAIRYYTLGISKFLLKHNCKMIVIACNSASAAAYQTLLDLYGNQVPIINVIDPLVNYTVSKNFESVAVIGTKITIASSIYKEKIQKLDPSIKVAQLATPLLVPMIEEGFHKDNISADIIAKYLSNEEFVDIDALLLACTHYPLIKKQIGNYFRNKIEILDSTKVVVDEIQQHLDNYNIRAIKKETENKFYLSDFTSSFVQTIKYFYDSNISLEEKQIWV